MPNYNSMLQENNLDLSEILDDINNLPDAETGDGGLDTSDATAAASDIRQSKTAYVDGEKITGTMPTVTQATPTINVNSNGLITASATQSTSGYVASGTKSATKQLTIQAAQTITPGTSNKTIASGRYLTGTQTIKGDSNLIAGNIKSGVSIFGITGNYEGSSSGDSGSEAIPKTSPVTVVNNSRTHAAKIFYSIPYVEELKFFADAGMDDIYPGETYTIHPIGGSCCFLYIDASSTSLSVTFANYSDFYLFTSLGNYLVAFAPTVDGNETITISDNLATEPA